MTPTGTLILDRFELLESGQGVVSRARDTATGGVVAVKRCTCGVVEAAHTAEILASLPAHPGIPSLLDSGPGVVVMPWFEGRPLSHVAPALGAPVPEFAMLLVRSAADALCAVHSAGIVYGAGLSNVWINDSRVVMLDFGSARFLSDEWRCRCGARFGGTVTYADDVAWLAELAVQLLARSWLPLDAGIRELSMRQPNAFSLFFGERFRGARETWPTAPEIRDALDGALATSAITDPGAALAALRADPEGYRRAFLARAA
jgi:serine/threonine protein kinase